MALTDITDKIIAEARENANAIEEETRQEVERIQEETERRKQELKAASDQQLEREKQHRREQARARANQEKKRTIEQAKREHIERVYDDARDRLTQLETSEYTQLVTTLARELPVLENGTAWVPAERSQETLQALTDAGVNLATTTTDRIQGGFIVETQKAEYDYSFESLIHEARQSAELDVASELFSSQ